MLRGSQSNPPRKWTGVGTLSAAVLGTLLFGVTIPLLRSATSSISIHTEPLNPDDYLGRARRILQETPLIDGHNDFPFVIRQQLHNEIYGHDFEAQRLRAHSDFQKMRKGLMGGQFWSVWVPCPEDLDPKTDLERRNKAVEDFNEPNWAVRDTLEQIDITKRLIAHYPGLLEYCTDAVCVQRAHKAGKIASMIGVEGGHQTGGSLGVLRLFFESGVRYMTLTHNCDNAFATSCVSSGLKHGKDVGLTKFGEAAVLEMNRLGMMVDLSHVSPNTMRSAIRFSRAPVIFSHSAAFNLSQHVRNVPDDVLMSLKDNGGLVMVPAVSLFLDWENPDGKTVDDLIDHILHIVKLAGWEHVGLGSDFDGSVKVLEGLEDTSQWPNFVSRLLAYGNATDEQAKLLVGDNLLRVWAEVQQRAREIQALRELPSEKSWSGRIWEPMNLDVPQVFAVS